jgi:hypothetical protein
MKLSNYFILFIFISMFVLVVSAQPTIIYENSRISWKNLRESYEKFKEIKPTITNESKEKLYYLSLYTDLRLLRLDEKSGEWKPNYLIICYFGESNKIKVLKLKPNATLPLLFGSYDYLSFMNSHSFPAKMTSRRYKFQFTYTDGKTDDDNDEIMFVSTSPEFLVSEKTPSEFVTDDSE